MFDAAGTDGIYIGFVLDFEGAIDWGGGWRALEWVISRNCVIEGGDCG